MKKGDRVNVVLGRGFGGPGTIVGIKYVVRLDNPQPAGGNVRDIDDFRVTRARGPKRAKR